MADRTWYHTSPTGEKTPITVDPSHITLTAPPGTDIWRPSLTADRFDAPHITTPIRSGDFRSLTCTVSGAWSSKFDQGGLLFLWPAASGQQSESKWLKTGIEFFEGKAALSVVGCDRFSDWSLSPIPEEGWREATIRVEREGTTLWVYALHRGEKRALREIKWAWMEGREADAELLVGVCAAKPAEGEGEGGLKVWFWDWELVEGQ